MKKFLTLLAVVALCCPMGEARTNWRFYVGGLVSQGKEDSGIDDIEKYACPVLMGGIDVQFIIKDKWHIETGLNYRHGPYAVRYDDCIVGDMQADWLSIPVRFGYRKALSEKNSLEFGLGPYVSYEMFSYAEERGTSPVSVGLSPVVTFKHRAFSVSLRYETPLFYNGMENDCKHMFAITVGVNFNGRKPNWETIGAVLDAANVVLGAANEALGNTSAGGSYDSGSYDDGSSSSYTSSSSGNYQQEYDRWANVAERHFNSITNLGYSVTGRNGKKSGGSGKGASPSTYNQQKKLFREAQKQMRKIRNKAAKAGVTIVKSAWEDATISY